MNIPKVYGFQFFWIFAIILPVLYPYYSSLGINMHQFFQLQAVFGFTVAFFEIPTGYFSDRFGRKKSLCLGGLLSGGSYWILTQATGYWGLFAHEFSLGLALSFVSGTDIAILFESLPLKFSRDTTSRILSHNQMAAALGESISALLCTVLMLSFTYKEIILLQAVVSWLPFLIALTLQEPKTHQLTTLKFVEIKKLWRQLLYEHTLTRLLVINFVVWLLATFIAIWVIQKYWQEQNIPILWFGLLWAASNIVVGLTGLFARKLEHKLGIANTLLLVALLSISAYLFMPLFGGTIGIIFGFFIYIARGLNNVVSRDLLNQNIDPSLRATANSILNFLFRVIFAIVGPGIGFSIDRWGLNTTLSVISFVFLLCVFFVSIPLWRRLTSDKAWGNLVVND